MGQKVNPLGIRLGITRDWISPLVRRQEAVPAARAHRFPRARVPEGEACKEASVSRILIERAAKKVNITIQTARPGIVIGKKGEDIEKLRQETAKLLGMPMTDVRLNIAEIRKPELDSQLVADAHRAADREARDVPPRHEARGDEHHAQRRAGREGARVRSPERLGDRAHRVVPRGPRPAAHLPRRHRLRPVRGAAPPTG